MKLMQNILLACALRIVFQWCDKCCFSPVPQRTKFCTQRWIMILSPANPLWILWSCHWKFYQISMPVDTIVHLFGCQNFAPHAVYKLPSQEMHHISNAVACLIFFCPFTFIFSGFKSEIWPRTGLSLSVFNGLISWKRLLSLPLLLTVSGTKVPIIIF